MFSVDPGDVANLLIKFTTLGQQVAELHKQVPEELTAWQREDMRRKFPNTEARSQTNQTVAATRIWPRGREELSRQTRQPRVAEPKNVQPRRFAPGRQVASDRPVLREVLKDKLDERMVNLMEEAMKWP